MPEINTSPTALRALADELWRRAPYGTTPHATSVLRALAAEKEADAATLQTLRASLAAAEQERGALRLAMVRVCNATDGYAAKSASTEFLLRVPAEVEACIGQLRAERIAATQLRLDLENAHAHCDVLVAERKDLIARAEKAEAERDALAGPLTYGPYSCVPEHAVQCAYLLSLAEADDDEGDAMTVVSLYVAGDVSMDEAIAALAAPAKPEDPAHD